ncbi:MAG: hemerythrin domain-containing protein [Candidatus Omnitrophica bacterium]|nr:hemerythrin domain-containing protein [Candidatus Omnitrophota bacterium]
MEKYLNTPIKEIITQFPQVGKILDEYNIGCVPCNVGSCLLKDIVQIHNLPEDEEAELMARIARVIYPDREIAIPKIERKAKAKKGEIRYSPPMKKLVDEHVIIKKWVALIPKVIENLDVETEEGRELILNGIDFIRSYADKFHHAKEEEILFKYFDEGLDILKVIHEDHETARGHAKAVLEAIDKKDNKEIAEHLKAYHDLLSEHIKKEDEILYPWMDRNLSTSQIGELFAKFNEADDRIGEEAPKRCKKFVEEVEQKLERRQ